MALAALALLAGAGKRGKPAKGAPGALSKAELMRLATAAGFPDPNLAAAVALAESGGNPRAIGVGPRERSIGLWQINLHAHKAYSEEALKIPEQNAAAAFAIYTSAGGKWTPWGAYTNGSYRRFL